MYDRKITALLSGLAATVLLSCPAHGQSLADAVSATMVDRFEVVSGNLLAAAERVPADQYGYRPTEDVRALGELFTHVTGAHYGYCAAVMGEPAPRRAQPENREQIIEALRASRDFCLRAYRETRGDALGGQIDVFGSSNSRVGVLLQNIAHDNLHYGNVVTYMRSIGLVPPSSE